MTKGKQLEFKFMEQEEFKRPNDRENERLDRVLYSTAAMVGGAITGYYILYKLEEAGVLNAFR